MEQQKQNKKIKRYPPKMDIIFQAIFGEVGSENITKDFLEQFCGMVNELKTFPTFIILAIIKGLTFPV